MSAVRFQPGRGLRNPHVQTIAGSVGRRLYQSEPIRALLARADTRRFTVPPGVVLQVDLDHRSGAPLVIVIPGWLGTARSSYVLSAAAALTAAGFSVARINLRDHGDTAHLNPGLFHCAMLDEVVALVEALRAAHDHPDTALLGYSLGGNFALRAARATGLPTLAVCPALDPAATMAAIDAGTVYRSYFIRKWRRLLRAKAAAFPGEYDFADALALGRVDTMTDWFVRHHSEFADTADYFSRYTLTGNALAGLANATLLASRDDPVVPIAQFAGMPEGPRLVVEGAGGHGGFLTSWRLDSWADDYAVRHFASLFGRGTPITRPADPGSPGTAQTAPTVPAD